MITVAIISEYNPFHTGHKYQIDRIREEFGNDTAIIAIMSGNYTQRGEVAICDKQIRAKCAIEAGVNLVLELPFPYSASSAEIFARSGVTIANAIGIVDYLSFGSECGSLSELIECAKIMMSDKYASAFDNFAQNKALGHAECCELAYRSLLADHHRAIEFSSNNILAIEYIKALLTSESKIKPHTIKRLGANYNNEQLDDTCEHPSAMSIRLLLDDPETSFPSSFFPDGLAPIISDALANGDVPCKTERLAPAILAKLRLNPLPQSSDIYDAGGGLYNRLHSASFEANSIHSLLTLSTTKKYTKARMRRAMWNSFFGVTSSDIKNSPRFTQVLAMDSIGMKQLKAIKKASAFQILTKPSDYDSFDEQSIRQKKLSENADAVFELTKPIQKSASGALRMTPYIKK